MKSESSPHLFKITELRSLDRAWQWHLQRLAEQLFSAFRICLVAGSALYWFFGAHPAGSDNSLEWTILALSGAFAVVNELVLYFDLPVARMLPLGTVAADWAMIATSIWATGGRNSPFQFFIVVGVVAATLRVPPKLAMFPTFAYVGLMLMFGDIDSLLPDAILIVVLGVGIALWSETMQRLHSSAVRDPLTGVYSRDFGLLQLEETLKRTRMPFVVAVLDLDGFKSVNDVHGHAAGDLVLRQVAHNMVSVLRPDDFLCRTGGDEFMAVFRDADVKTAAVLAERLRAIVASSAISLRDENKSVSVTLSIGLAEAKVEERSSDVICAADDAMYDAKTRRNSVVVADRRQPTDVPQTPRLLQPR